MSTNTTILYQQRVHSHTTVHRFLKGFFLENRKRSTYLSSKKATTGKSVYYLIDLTLPYEEVVYDYLKEL